MGDDGTTVARGDVSVVSTGEAARDTVGDVEAEAERDGGGDMDPVRACARWRIVMLPRW